MSPDGRTFVDSAGAPFFWLGDTAWPLFTQYSKEQAEAYLSNRAAKGFTVIQGVLAWGHGSGMEQKIAGRQPAGPEALARRRPGEAQPGLLRVRRPPRGLRQPPGPRPRDAPDLGLLREGDPPSSTPTNARAYGRWLGARYKNAPNVVWVNGGDRTPTGFEDVFRELARGLREGDGGAHLITYHPCGWRSSAQFFHGEDWLDFNMIETWTEWAKIYPAVVADALRAPRKPVVLGEGAYEDGPEYPQGPITPLLVRRQAWWTVMAGGFHTYGQNQMWRMEPGWDKTFDTPGAAQVCLMKRILTGAPVVGPPPGPGRLRERRRQRAHPERRDALEGRQPASWSISPAPRPCSSTSTRSRRRRRRATWISPVTGEKKDAGTFRHRQPHRQRLPRLPHAVLQDPGLLGGRRPAPRRQRGSGLDGPLRVGSRRSAHRLRRLGACARPRVSRAETRGGAGQLRSDWGRILFAPARPARQNGGSHGGAHGETQPAADHPWNRRTPPRPAGPRRPGPRQPPRDSRRARSAVSPRTRAAAPYLDPARPLEARVEDLLARLTLEEKVGLVHANGKFRAGGVERLGVPHLWTADGPQGVREEVGRRLVGAGRLDERLRDRDAGRHGPRVDVGPGAGRGLRPHGRRRGPRARQARDPRPRASTSRERRCAAATTTTSARTRGSPAA